MAQCETCSWRPASLKVPWSATAQKYRKCLSSIGYVPLPVYRFRRWTIAEIPVKHSCGRKCLTLYTESPAEEASSNVDCKSSPEPALHVHRAGNPHSDCSTC